MHIHIHNTAAQSSFLGKTRQYKLAILLFCSVAKLTALEIESFFVVVVFCYCCYIQGFFTIVTIVPCTAFETRSVTRENNQSFLNIKLIFTVQLGQCNSSFLKIRGFPHCFFHPSPFCSLSTPQQSSPQQPFSDLL